MITIKKQSEAAEHKCVGCGKSADILAMLSTEENDASASCQTEIWLCLECGWDLGDCLNETASTTWTESNK